jgi:putative flippase GtrA
MGVGMLAVLVEVIRLNKYLAGPTVTVISVEVTFLLNKYLNWSDRRGSLVEQWLRFHLVRLGTVTFNQCLYFALVSLGVHYLLVAVLASGVSAAINYLSNEAFVFRQTGDKDGR